MMLGRFFNDVLQHRGGEGDALLRFSAWYLGLLGGLYLAKESLLYSRRLVVSRTTTRIDREMTVKLVSHLLRVDLDDAAAGVGLGPVGRHGEERQVAGRDPGGLPGEPEHVPAAVEDHRLLHDLDQPGQLRRVGERPPGEDLVRHRGEEHLLAADA